MQALASSNRFGGFAQNSVICHRGAQVRARRDSDHFIPKNKTLVVHPENTLASIEEALKQGNAAELDVTTNGEFITRNGKKVPYLPIFHDDEMGRPFKIESEQTETRPRFLDTKTIQNAQFDRDTFIDRVITPYLGPKAHPDLPKSHVYLDEGKAATRIPTLDEVFEVLKKYPKGHLYVEIKTLTQNSHEDTKGLEKKVIGLIKEFDLQKQITVISFNPFVLKKAKKLAQREGLSQLTTAWDIDALLLLKGPKSGMEQLLGWAKKIKVDAILPYYEETSAELIKMAHAAGLKVMPWVWQETREKEIARIPQLQKMGVDGVITNTPSDAMYTAKILKQLNVI